MKRTVNGHTLMTNGRFRELFMDANENNELVDAFEYEGHTYFTNEFLPSDEIAGYDAVYFFTAHYGIAIKYSDLQDAVKIASFY